MQPAVVPEWRIDRADAWTWLARLPAESVDLVVTDPAYSGMNAHLRLGRGRIVGSLHEGRRERWFAEEADDVARYGRLFAEIARVLRPGRHAYVMFDSFSLLSLAACAREHLLVKGIVVWNKGRFGMGHYFRRQHELILFVSKGRRAINRHDLADVWEVPPVRGRYPAQKPVAVFSRMLQASAEAGYVVCDPFCGSGTSALAAVAGACAFIGCDIDAVAVRTARARMERWLHDGVDVLEPGMARGGRPRRL